MNNVTVICNKEHLIEVEICAFCQRDEYALRARAAEYNFAIEHQLLEAERNALEEAATAIRDLQSKLEAEHLAKEEYNRLFQNECVKHDKTIMERMKADRCVIVAKAKLDSAYTTCILATESGLTETGRVVAKIQQDAESRLAAVFEETRERCAKVCEELEGDSGKPTDRLIGYQECAEAIRALNRTAAPQEGKTPSNLEALPESQCPNPAPAAALCPGCGQLNNHDMYKCVQDQIAAMQNQIAAVREEAERLLKINTERFQQQGDELLAKLEATEANLATNAMLAEWFEQHHPMGFEAAAQAIIALQSTAPQANGLNLPCTESAVNYSEPESAADLIPGLKRER